MRFRIGTSGFSYAPWRGSFYPEGHPEDEMLSFYAARFDAVEINNTFYRMPSPRILEGWAKDVPESFVFALKTPRYITPNAKPSDKGDPIVAFFERTSVLATRMGPALVMIPPFLKKKNADLLAAFLDGFPRDRRVVVELRAPDWLADDVYEVLRARNIALCITDADDLTIPPVRTASFAYARLRRSSYDRAELTDWSKRLADLGVDDALVFFKHEDEGTGPRYAAEFRSIVG
jgi:uncharacterized protein YecE (DUF72 family)